MALLVKPEPLGGDFTRLFETLFQAHQLGGAAQRWAPPMDLVEADDHFVLKADLPGVGEESVAIEVQDNTLTISGERKSDQPERQQGWYRLERPFGRFSRSVTLPEGINADGIAAVFDRGVLEVTIPKPEERKPRRIAIANGEPAENGGPPTIDGTATG